jgi:transposase
METSILLPCSSGLRLEGLSYEGGQARLTVSSTRPTGNCPACGQPGTRVHSSYVRTLQDLPWQGTRVVIRWRSRKFFCDSPGCPQRIFTERLPAVTWPYGRRTARLRDVLQYLGLALGGEHGCRVARRLAMPVSGDTLLRTVRRATFPPEDSPLVVGVDDWAMRRGQRYGTVIVDLERHRAIGLLPDRKWETFRDWRTQRPGVQIVSRDRASCYAQGAAAGAPEAVQVVDRWHLLKNLREALKRSAERFSQEIQQAADDVPRSKRTSEPVPPAVAVTVTAEPAPAVPPMSVAPAGPPSRREIRRFRRRERYQQVHELHAQGKSQRNIARILHLDRDTVRRFLLAATFPERAARAVPRDTDPYVEYLRQRWSEGCLNARTLMREIVERGYRGSYDAVKRRVATWRQGRRSETRSGLDSAAGGSASHPPRSSLDRLSANRVAWLLFLHPDELQDQERQLREAICQHCPSLVEAAELAHDFCALVKKRQANGLSGWIARASAAAVTPELRRFAIGLLADLKAIEAALTLPWSNGQTEGQVNRLKLLKREMYGRAKLDLLNQRFLHPIP